MTWRNVIACFSTAIIKSRTWKYVCVTPAALSGRVLNGSKAADPQPTPEGLKSVHSGSLNQNPVGPFRVDSRRLAKSYIESVPTSEFGATTDIR
jgi:hypothetical protein